MKFKLSTGYSEEELKFIEENHGEILSEIKLSRVNFSAYEIPRRMFRYGGEYIAEVLDEESNQLIWAVLSKWKGVYSFSQYYDSLVSLEEGL